jgi:hypothetical protein
MQRPLTVLALVALSFVGLAALRIRQQQVAGKIKANAGSLPTWEGDGAGLTTGGSGHPTTADAAAVSDAAVYADAAEREASA